MGAQTNCSVEEGWLSFNAYIRLKVQSILEPPCRAPWAFNAHCEVPQQGSLQEGLLST